MVVRIARKVMRAPHVRDVVLPDLKRAGFVGVGVGVGGVPGVLQESVRSLTQTQHREQGEQEDTQVELLVRHDSSMIPVCGAESRVAGFRRTHRE